MPVLLPVFFLLAPPSVWSQSQEPVAPPTLSEIARDNERMRAMESDRDLRAERETELMDRHLRDTWPDESRKVDADFVLLPPLPPVLGAAQYDIPLPPYPVVLADHAGENFFMAYGSTHLRRLIGGTQRRRVERYRALRERLLAEIRAAGTDPAALAAVASRQESAQRELEAEAEAIRAELARLDGGRGLLKLRDDSAAGRSPGLRTYFSAVHAAQYQPALSADQRQLLLEIALEALLDSRSAADRTFSFLPAPARIRWPDQAPARLVALARMFTDLRNGLKTELQETIVTQASPDPEKASGRNAALAARQAPRFAELHRLAEDVRVQLAPLIGGVRPAPSGHPPALVREVGSLVARKNVLQARAQRWVEELNREFAPTPHRLSFREGRPVIEVVPVAAAPAAPDRTPPAQLARLHACNMQLQQDFRQLAEAMAIARAKVQEYRASLDANQAPSAGKLSSLLAREYAEEELWERFADYRTAVLVPGLTPGQRNLLFRAALSRLEHVRLAGL